MKPDTRLAVQAGLKLGSAKGIFVNEFLQTSDPDIYAVGDAIEFENPITGISMNTYLAGPANKQGRICANNMVLGNKEKYTGAINTAIVKVFDMTVATAGTASKQLKKANIPHLISTTHSSSHATYYPGSEQMHIQIVFSPDNGRLLNAQIVGYAGVDKRMEMFSSVIKRNSTIYELMVMEHAYAPPFSSAKDPVNIAGFVAENILADKMTPWYWDQINHLDSDSMLIDVRTESEYMAEKIPGSINIPLDKLRNQLNQIPIDKSIYLYCQIGLRGYLAQSILKQNGYLKTFNLSGGFFTWAINTQENKLPLETSLV